MFENTDNRTELSALGEFGLIELLSKSIQLYNKEVIKGIGDDAAVLNLKASETIVTTDMLTESIHFDLSYTPLQHLGYKAVAVNISDLCAMNATPLAITVSLAISNRFSVEAIEELYAGMMIACERYKVDMVGGDTVSSAGGLTISITAIGQCQKEKIIYRNGAAEKDLICVTGDLGAAYLGLQLLKREKKIFLENPGIQPDLSGNDYCLERQLKPEARIDIIKKFAEVGLHPSAMIDISDGLASELFHLCKQSNVGCRVYEEKIPIDMKAAELAEELNLNPITCAFNGGEDYELLFTVPVSQYELIKGITDINIIGHITEPITGLYMIDRGNQEIQLRAQGWNAFDAKNN